LVPVLFTIAGVPVYSYGFFFALALLSGGALLVAEARRRRWPKEEVIPITLAAFVGGMVGARVSILFFNGLATARESLDLYTFFDPRIGPGSILGAVAGAYIGGYIASKAIGKDSCACDAFAPAMALAMGVGRVGAFLAGVDGLGKPTDLPWGVTLPGLEYAVHPTPLYDAAFNFMWLAILLLLRDHRRMQSGNLLKFGLLGYLVFRFFNEFLRTNRVIAIGLTGQQFFSLGLAIGVGVYLLRAMRRTTESVSRILPI